MEQINVTIQTEEGRTDKVLGERLSNHSRSQIQQWLEEKHVTVNGETVRANYKVTAGDGVIITIPEPEALDMIAEDTPLTIVYEDNDVTVVNKPQDMVVHPSAGHSRGTLMNALLHHVDHLSMVNDVVWPGIVHRIDKDTSGLLIVAKNDQAHESLAKRLKGKTSLRKYVALVRGAIPHDKGEINTPVSRSRASRKIRAVVEDGKGAVTHFTALECFDAFTLAELQLKTGRAHQIRVHMKYIGYPLAGDPLYGPKKTLLDNGRFLYAKLLNFTHPTTGEQLVFEAPLPEIFEKTLHQLRNNRWFFSEEEVNSFLRRKITK